MAQSTTEFATSLSPGMTPARRPPRAVHYEPHSGPACSLYAARYRSPKDRTGVGFGTLAEQTQVHRIGPLCAINPVEWATCALILNAKLRVRGGAKSRDRLRCPRQRGGRPFLRTDSIDFSCLDRRRRRFRRHRGGFAPGRTHRSRRRAHLHQRFVARLRDHRHAAIR